ncbi:2-dehydropantoate 2-reductase [Gemmatimonas sp.]|uniref:ketopantoate reductase family protein n=1 Tax=Gemmatimonas sp. TaxID=1962908 RepID=UPI0022C8797A|nr:2-dehydropantoate 2-reductase [Gemmatimonas sp.]MCZ8205768.1 2-dehydropantoate 2-reductase [Gemmatimonas sp.]
MRIAVVGAGAVGGVFGARLAAAGHDVTFIARGATLAVLRARGMQLDSVHGDVQLPAVQATDDPSSVGPVDLVLVGVKATQVVAIAPTLAPLLGPATAVIPLQNGVEASVQLAAALGNDHILEGLCRVIAEQAAPGHVRHMAVTPLLEFGPRAGHPPAPAVAAAIPAIAEAVRGAGLQALIPADMAVALWEKFLFIEPIGVVCAATGESFGPVRTVPETRELVDRALDEVIAVGQAVGVTWPADAKRTVWQRYDGLPPDERTSMARDLLARRPSEFEAQTAAVGRLGRSFGVPTPVHDVLAALLRPRVIAAL